MTCTPLKDFKCLALRGVMICCTGDANALWLVRAMPSIDRVCGTAGPIGTVDAGKGHARRMPSNAARLSRVALLVRGIIDGYKATCG